MQCSTCKREAIIFQPYSGRHLCRDHLILDLEAKAKRTIRVHHWLHPGDHLGVALTGDSAGNALLFFLRKLTGNRKDIRVSAITPEEGTNNCDTIHDPGITKIAAATTLEDAAASALTRILRGDTGIRPGDGSFSLDNLPRITPFSHIPSGEIAAYARLCGVESGAGSQEVENDLLFIDVRNMLADYSSRHPATPHAVLNLWESLTGPGNIEHKGGC